MLKTDARPPGGSVDYPTATAADQVAAQGHYMSMLMAIISLGAPRSQEGPAPLSAEAWMFGLNAREASRAAWEALFHDYDVVLAPPFGTAAFPHDDRPGGSRTLTIDGDQVPYFSQIAWPGVATFPGLPATCVPAGRTPEGLPTGVQIIGPYWEDRTTLALAGLIERELV